MADGLSESSYSNLRGQFILKVIGSAKSRGVKAFHKNVYISDSE